MSACTSDHPLWILFILGHHRPAEAHRARPPRHCAGALQVGGLPSRGAARRGLFLLFHHRLDGLEHADARAADERAARCFMTATQPTPMRGQLWRIVEADASPPSACRPPSCRSCAPQGVAPGQDFDICGAAVGDAHRLAGDAGNPRLDHRRCRRRSLRHLAIGRHRGVLRPARRIGAAADAGRGNPGPALGVDACAFDEDGRER